MGGEVGGPARVQALNGEDNDDEVVYTAIAADPSKVATAASQPAAQQGQAVVKRKQLRGSYRYQFKRSGRYKPRDKFTEEEALLADVYDSQNPCDLIEPPKPVAPPETKVRMRLLRHRRSTSTCSDGGCGATPGMNFSSHSSCTFARRMRQSKRGSRASSA